jgi:hypothetical protein
MIAARATADRKFLASLSYRVAMRRSTDTAASPIKLDTGDGIAMSAARKKLHLAVKTTK